ncbi:hypothetical protein [Phreatobacter stygius]|uniref:Uncharacterized protein n=1 Tax=Phreatobacter stygius TaxID=1940610 RepID=A0A4D7B4W3_9HYPH|nr:hypothetical protein [Phreatobacter stygius]QCI63252.1 hypothetical protein E8M01_02790 [Phreatobacter stygius]
MRPYAPVERFALAATPARLALALAAVLAAFLISAFAHAPIEQLLRGGDCSLIDCLRPLRPETRHAGYGAEDFRAFLVQIGALRGRALTALAADLPLIAALGAALLTGAGIATRGLPLAPRTFRLLFLLPVAFVVADLVEDGLLALAYAGLADTSTLVPWASSLKFALIAGSTVSSLLLGMARWALRAPSE